MHTESVLCWESHFEGREVRGEMRLAGAVPQGVVNATALQNLLKPFTACAKILLLGCSREDTHGNAV